MEEREYVPFIKKSFSRVLIVGESPGQEEVRQRRPFVGPSGKILRKTLGLVGLNLDFCSIANSVPFFYKSGETPSTKVVDENNETLFNFIKEVKPNIIIGLGGVALYALTGKKNIMEWSGQLFNIQGYKVGCTIHPALVYRNPDYGVQFFLHLLKFSKEANSKTLTYEPAAPYHVLKTIDDLSEAYEEIKGAPALTLDTETTGFDALEDKVLCLGINNIKNNYIIPMYSDGKVSEIPEEHLRKWLNEVLSTKAPKILFNTKFDLKFLYKFGLNKIYPIEDTMYILRMVEENLNPRGPSSLKLAVRTFMNKPNYEEEVHKYAPSKKDSYVSVPKEILWKYLAEDIQCTYQLYKKFKPKLSLKQKNLLNLLYEFTEIQTESELQGIKIVKEKLSKVDNELKAKMVDTETSIYRNAGKEFNINSTKQLREVLQNLKLKLKHKTAKGLPSTNVDALEALSGQHPIISDLLRYRKLMKLYTTYVKGLKKNIKGDRVYPDFNLVGTPTGRTSCRGVNVQQIPRKPEIIRQLFYPEENHFWIEADFSRAELYVLGYYSGDSLLIKDLHAEDFHTLVAKELGLTDENGKVGSEDRMVAKAVVFGLCVTGDSEILINRSEKVKIKDVVNQQFYVYDGVGFHPATAYFTRQDKVYKVKYKFRDDVFLKCSGDHLILTRKDNSVKWISVKDLEEGDEIAFDKRNSPRRIVNISQKIPKPLQIYDWFVVGRDIEIEETDDIEDMYDLSVNSKFHAFACNGFIVHNCYGASALGLSDSTGLPVKNVEKIMNRFFSRYQRAGFWIEAQRLRARRGQSFEYFSGRIRHCFPLTVDNRALSDLERKMINSPIQGTVADVIFESSYRIVKRFEKENIRGRYLFLIHDASYFSVNKKNIEKSITIIREEMERPFFNTQYSIPVDIVIGNYWKDPKSIEI